MAAIPFIVHDGEGFIVRDEAKAMLAALEPPIAVLAVAGKFRTGKSFLLNRLIGQSKGFEVGPTVEACTHGEFIYIFIRLYN